MIDLQETARIHVFRYVRKQTEGTPQQGQLTSMDQVRCSWFCKLLGGWKACVVTNLDDDTYYEVTHDGERRVTYLDAYVKFDQVVIPDEGVTPPAPLVIKNARLRELVLSAEKSVFPGAYVKAVEEGENAPN